MTDDIYKVPFKDRSDDEKDFHAMHIKKLQDIFAKEFGVFAFPCFGTLIGVIRENDFVEGDHDVDMMWIATGKNRSEVCRHAMAMYHELKKRDLFYGIGSAGGQCNVRMVSRIENKNGYGGKGATVVDLFVGWFENGNLWSCQWGEIGPVDASPAEIMLRKEKILIPDGSDMILTKLYGDWRVPKDDHPSKRLQRRSYLFDL
jgi:hypothetical protein